MMTLHRLSSLTNPIFLCLRWTDKTEISAHNDRCRCAQLTKARNLLKSATTHLTTQPPLSDVFKRSSFYDTKRRMKSIAHIVFTGKQAGCQTEKVKTSCNRLIKQSNNWLDAKPSTHREKINVNSTAYFVPFHVISIQNIASGCWCFQAESLDLSPRKYPIMTAIFSIWQQLSVQENLSWMRIRSTSGETRAHLARGCLICNPTPSRYCFR